MIPREILKKIRQIEIRTNRIVFSKLAITLAVALASVLFVGCQSAKPQDPCKMVITALNNDDWATLERIAPPGSRATEYIEMWKQTPVWVGHPVSNDNHPEYPGKSSHVYSFTLKNKNGTINPHWLQIIVRKQPNGQDKLVDFWNFGW